MKRGDFDGLARSASDSTCFSLQELFSLADACELPSLCADISALAVVTGDSVRSWLDFLSKEHESDVQTLRTKVKHTVKSAFEKLTSEEAFRAGLDGEQLSSLALIAENAVCGESPLREGMKSSSFGLDTLFSG